MSLQRYVRQLKPIQEKYVDHVEQVQDLYEATLSKADINKRDNFKVFKDIIDNQKPLKTTKGDVSISWVDNQYKIAYDKGDLDAAFPRATPVFISSKGDKLKLSDIAKTDMVGGG